MKPEDGGLPGLSAEVVQEWSAEWNDVGLWDDVLVLANGFWSAPEADRAMAWHHLLLAVGNFKRPGGTRLHLKLSGPPPENAYPESMKIPGIGCVIVFENAGGWRCLQERLQEMRGLGVATTTTLLSALWPEHSAPRRPPPPVIDALAPSIRNPQVDAAPPGAATAAAKAASSTS